MALESPPWWLNTTRCCWTVTEFCGVQTTWHHCQVSKSGDVIARWVKRDFIESEATMWSHCQVSETCDIIYRWDNLSRNKHLNCLIIYGDVSAQYLTSNNLSMNGRMVIWWQKQSPKYHSSDLDKVVKWLNGDSNRTWRAFKFEGAVRNSLAEMK